MERYDVLRDGAATLSDGYYENFVLNTFNWLRKGRTEPILRDLVEARVDSDLVLGPGQPAEDQRFLRAVLGAARQPRPDVSLENLNRHLAADFTPDGVPEFEAEDYLAVRLDARKGFPGRSPQHWLTSHNLAGILRDAVASGVFAEHILTDRLPRAFDSPTARKAVDRERSRLDLDTAMQAAIDAHIDLRLADAVESRPVVEAQWERRETALKQLKSAQRAFEVKDAAYNTALGAQSTHLGTRRRPSSGPSNRRSR